MVKVPGVADRQQEDAEISVIGGVSSSFTRRRCHFLYTVSE